MRISLFTTGTRGDVVPFVSLALALKRAGHDVVACVPASQMAIATAAGITAAPLDDELIRLKETPEGKEALQSPRARLALVKRVRPMIRRQLDDAWGACQSADAIIAHPKALAGPHIAERLGIRCFVALPVPLMVQTGDFAAPGMPKLLPGALGNRLSHWLTRLVYVPFTGVINDWRAESLGLPKRSAFSDPRLTADGSRILVLFAFSPTLVPRATDWDVDVHVTGDWRLPEVDWAPSPGLQAFLGEGPPPVYVGFGSIPTKDSARTSKLVIDALSAAGLRGVLATGGDGLSRVNGAPPTVHFLSGAPHSWLFPRMQAVVHHGGAGTTHAGLRAGRPTIVCPIFGDQPFWGRRVEALGAGPAPIAMRSLTPSRLAKALVAATSDESFKDRAHSLSQAMANEDGVERAVEVIHASLREGGPRE